MRRNRKLDRLWRLWYALLVLLLQAFLLYAAACRYLDYRHRAMRESWRQEPMNCYLAAILSAACLATLFAYASFARTGNFADDGVSVGREPASLRLAMLESGVAGAPVPTSCPSRMRRHFLPPTCGLHLLMALCLLAPLPALEAEAVLHEEAPREAIWSTSLDFLLRDHRTSRLLATPDETPRSSGGTGVSAEVANLILALCLLLVRYPSAFWLASRPFSLLFSAVLCACCIHVLLSREASAVLLRSALVGNDGGCLPAAAVPALQIISDLMLLTACVAFFEFGYGRVLSSLSQLRPYLLQQQKHQQQRRLLNSKQPDHLDSVSNCGMSGVGPSSDYSSHQAGKAACCQRGILAAQVLGSLLMLAAGLIKAPLLWDWLALYRRRRVPVLLAAIASGGAYAVVWTGAWLLLGLCRSAAVCQFDIRVELSRDVAEQEELVEIDDDSSAAAVAGGSSALRGIDGDGNPRVDGMAPGQSPSQRRQQQSVQSPYMYHHHQQQFRIGEGVGMISTISERLDAASEDGGASGSGGSSGAGSDKLSGLVKYQVRRDSSGGSLRRSPGGGSASHSRVVTFKESIGGVSTALPPQLSFLASTASPASSQVGGASSSDSGVADYQLNLLHQHHQHHQNQTPLFAAFGGGHEAVATYATRSEIFAPTFKPPPPPPPTLSSTLMSTSAASATASVSTRVPDILMTRCGQFQQQQQQQQQLHSHGSLGRGIRKPMSLFGRQLSSELLEMLPPPPSPPPPPLPPSQQLLQRDDHVDGLCSQV